MDPGDLRKRLDEIAAIPDSQWLSALDERKKKELEFHDRDRDAGRIQSLDEDDYEKLYGNRKFYKGVTLSRAYVDKWIADHAKGKVFLDYACGTGLDAVKAAKAGAKLAIGLDISPISVENAKRLAEEEGVAENTYFLQADAENTRLPDESVDSIMCNGMLHHLDLSYAFPELRRILVPGGILCAYEALNYNPFIKLYRVLTPQMRTVWEKNHILSHRDLRFAERFFDIGEVRYWHIASILTAYVGMLPLLNACDKLLTGMPLIRLMAWQFTFELIKSDN